MQVFEAFGIYAAVLLIVAMLAVGLMIHSMGLRVAALWLGLGQIPLKKAISCSLMMFLAPAAISFQNAFQVSFIRSSIQGRNGNQNFFDYSLTNAISPNLLSSIAVLCVVATIVSCAVPTRDAEAPVISNLSFRESVALTMVSTVVTTLAGGVLGLIAFAIISLFA